MKIRNLIQVILITLAIHSVGFSDSKDKTLWGGAEYGMTPAQVLKVFPDAIKNPDKDASYDSVIIPETRIGLQTFKVYFFLGVGELGRDRILKYVKLEAVTPSVATFNNVEELLVLKYGKPIKKGKWANLEIYNREWFADPLTVKLLFTNVDDDASLYIMYSHEKKLEMDSL